MKNLKNIFYMAIIAISVIASVVMCVQFKNSPAETASTSDSSERATLAPRKDTTIVTVNTEVINDGLKNMGFLVTQEYYFTQVETYKKEKPIFKYFKSSSVMAFSYDGSVTAGVDFEKIDISKDDTSKTITVNIPDSEIQTVIIDKDSFKKISEDDSLWNPLEIEDYNNAIKEFEEAAKKKAIESGILERSDDQAKKLIENFINNFPSVSDYKIEYK
ncbi:MAG: DUF4230 domain-containing protein [Butyrivibrio sp.]|nr:DUF4230 domain-containing protein [Butyrivibrio sp.]